MKASKIRVTEKAARLHPSLVDCQVFKNWVLERCRADHPELMAQLDDLDVKGAKALDFASDHYGPLGLKVFVCRDNGLHVVVCGVDEATDFKQTP